MVSSGAVMAADAIFYMVVDAPATPSCGIQIGNDGAGYLSQGRNSSAEAMAFPRSLVPPAIRTVPSGSRIAV